MNSSYQYTDTEVYKRFGPDWKVVEGFENKTQKEELEVQIRDLKQIVMNLNHKQKSDADNYA